MRMEELLLLTPKTRKVFLRDYVIKMGVGAYEHEKIGVQRVRFNVEVWVPNLDTADELGNVFNYEKITQAIDNIVSRGHVHLQEALASSVAHAIVEEEGVLAVRVKTEKLDVLPDNASFGVEIFVGKDDQN